MPGTGPVGRSNGGASSDPDPLDYFRVAGAAGQVVRLFVAENNPPNDLDLALLTEAGAEVAASDTANSIEEIIVATTGTYLVEVSAIAGFSNYVLIIGQMSAGAGAVVAGADYVPGELIVELDDGEVGGIAAMSASTRARSLGMRHLRGDRDDTPRFSWYLHWQLPA